MRVAGNQGATRSVGKVLAKIQGGWNSESGQSRYDRADLADVVSIPMAIIGTWDARQSDFELSAVEGVQSDVLPPPPPAGGTSPPEERQVVRAVGSANLRVAQPFASPSLCSGGRRAVVASSSGRRPASASSTRAATAPAISSSEFCAGEQSHGPVATPPDAPPRHAAAQRRVEGSGCLSLSRPVRASRLLAIAHLPVGVAGSWRSSPSA